MTNFFSFFFQTWLHVKLLHTVMGVPWSCTANLFFNGYSTKAKKFCYFICNRIIS